MFLNYDPKSPEQCFWQVLAEISQEIPDQYKQSVEKSWAETRQGIVQSIRSDISVDLKNRPLTAAILLQDKVRAKYNEIAAYFLENVFTVSQNDPSFLQSALETVRVLYPESEKEIIAELGRKILKSECALNSYNENKEANNGFLANFADVQDNYKSIIMFLAPAKPPTAPK